MNPWNTSEPPHDRPIVAKGRIIYEDEFGVSTIPFLAEIQWTEKPGESEGWHDSMHGMSIAVVAGDTVKIDFWAPVP